MKSNNSYIVSYFLIALFFILAYFFENNKSKNNEEIDKNTKTAICKVFNINSKRSFTEARYYFFYEGSRYESGKYIDTSGDEYLNNYFEIEFSSKDPNNSRIFLNKEIKDLVKIKEAGF